ncbi:FliA/WhiG family RNA polymerase sigma factor [Dechloromonas sp. TW-R-39-2]|uniref:RNA polymerase sigma factor FliA n=1 Tax=Dechloromonas TaxID=73029 RepID=UPI00193D461A|nr:MULTISPECIES: RNA polymerase sigma factor FliA [Dechloromonas]QRM20517.1 FliA/WhiG family RNA polymerase sigma factor [Dechloromonas sp. TW-R-39-2]UCV10951.1 RNA polymerase sigma factor FliA [Dechloromonas denitrificans]
MYTAAGQPDREQLVQRFVPLVKRIAYHLMARLPASVQFEDLVQNGMLGLLDAIDRFEEGFGAQFETYATQRVRGAMLDGLRENDWLPRQLRRELRRIEAMINQLEHEHGRAPSERELADALGMSLADYQKTLGDARGHQLLYFEDFTGEGDEDFLERHFTDNDADPLSLLEEKSLQQALVGAIERLPEREKLMMALYYEQDLNLREIGEVMGVTESRVCQLHSQAVARLRSQIVGQLPAVKKQRKEKVRG